MWRVIAAAVIALASLSSVAQVVGVAPSVTSIGPNGISTAPPASVTSLGGWQQFPRGEFFPKNPQLFHHRPRFNHFGLGHGQFGSSVLMVPYYVPYPVDSYAEQEYSDATAPSQAERQPVVLLPYANPAPAAVPYPPVPTPSAPAPPTAAETPTAPLPEQEATVLVFRDGRRMEVRNYAIVGQELIRFSGKGPRRIPLADLDLDNTMRENENRGITFRLPTPRGS